MLLILDKQEYDIRSIYFGEKSKNNIIDNSFFYNITYITPLLSIQHLHIGFNLKNITLDTYYNKYKITMRDKNINSAVLKKMIHIESSILYLFNKTKQKECNYKLKTQIDNNILKCISNINVSKKIYDNIDFLIKISGIWENSSEIGLIYKLILV
jgi:hypothetical protein